MTHAINLHRPGDIARSVRGLNVMLHSGGATFVCGGTPVLVLAVRGWKCDCLLPTGEVAVAPDDCLVSL